MRATASSGCSTCRCGGASHLGPVSGERQISGTATANNEQLVPMDSNPVLGRVATSNIGVDWDVIARDRTFGQFARFDVHGSPGSTCTFWGMSIPSG